MLNDVLDEIIEAVKWTNSEVGKCKSNDIFSQAIILMSGINKISGLAQGAKSMSKEEVK